MLKVVFVNIHLFASIVWVGSVFMGTFVDWPAAQLSVKKGEFPFGFIINQGRKVFLYVYIGIFFLWTSGIGLVMLHPPFSNKEIIMLTIKVISLVMMTAFTMYGTFSTWRKLQVATNAEAFQYYKFYMYRAMGTFFCGSLASILGRWLYSGV